MKYKVTYWARQAGAIGEFRQYVEVVESSGILGDGKAGVVPALDLAREKLNQQGFEVQMPSRVVDENGNVYGPG